MKLLSVSELSRLPWNTQVEGVVGVVQMVHPRMGQVSWSLQNGRLADPGGEPVVEFMLSKHVHYWEPEQVKGKRIEIRATRPDDLVWKEQKPKPNVNKGRPFAKLEIAVTAQIAFVEAGPAVLPGFSEPAPAPAPAVPPAPLPLPANPRLPAPAATPSSASVGDLRTQLRQMIGLHAVVERVVTEEAKPEERPVLVERLFSQACAQGLFRGLDPEAIILELDPTAASRLRPNLTRLAALAEGREDMVNLVLRGTGMISMDRTWRELTEAEAGKVLQRADLQGVLAKAS